MELHALSEDEVIAVRLYTGPGYQLINTYLREASAPTRKRGSEGARPLTPRDLVPYSWCDTWQWFQRPCPPICPGAQVGKLSLPMRRALARTPSLTYAATVRAVCSAIRKLARVNVPGLGDCCAEEQRRLCWRGVRGTLPASFWQADVAGMVVATELGLMSTSTGRETPFQYMQGVDNVLWELLTAPEDERGYHSGADVSLLSQFAHEKEELFPPLTMLRVLSAVDYVAESAPPDDSQSRVPGLARGLAVSLEHGSDGVSCLKITVEPTFV